MNTQCIKECCIAFHHFYKPEIIWQYIATSICALLQGSITWFSYNQWRRLHGARGTCPHFYKWLHGHGCTVSRRTANKKLTKLHWPSRKRSPKRLIVLLEPKSGVTRPTKFFSGASRRIDAPTFKFVAAPLYRYNICSSDCIDALSCVSNIVLSQCVDDAYT